MTNILIDLQGDRAGSESYVYGTMRRAQDGKLLQLGVWARYLDAREKRAGPWGLLRRMVDYDHEGEREAPAMVPCGARVSAGKLGRVEKSLPTSAESAVNLSPVSCIPSPESPANLMTTRFRG